MIDVENCRQNAADCVRQAQSEDSTEGRDLLLNVALAWLRLAQQARAMESEASPQGELLRDDELVVDDETFPAEIVEIKPTVELRLVT
jgi:hypothetical protein